MAIGFWVPALYTFANCDFCGHSGSLEVTVSGYIHYALWCFLFMGIILVEFRRGNTTFLKDGFSNVIMQMQQGDWYTGSNLNWSVKKTNVTNKVTCRAVPWNTCHSVMENHNYSYWLSPGILAVPHLKFRQHISKRWAPPSIPIQVYKVIQSVGYHL